MKFKYLLLIILSFPSFVFTQIDSNNILDDKLFQLLEDASEDIEDGVFFEIIDDLTRTPVDINNANSSELLRIPFLTPTDAQQIITSRNKMGKFNSFEDITRIKGIDKGTLALIKPFIFINENLNSENNKQDILNYYFRSRAKSDIQNREGFLNGNYKGSKLNFYNKLFVNSNNFSAGILTEKDAGEINFTDHFTGFVQYKSANLFNNIVLGDYSIEFGEGLALWSAYSFSKGSDAINPPIKRVKNIRPHLSSEENRHFRGAAVSIKFNSSLVTGFYSLNTISATLNDENNISNFYQIGYYRTETEQEKKNNLKETVYGITYGLKISEYFNLGMLHYQTKYDKSFQFINGNKLSGNSFSFSSIHAKLLYKNFNISSEVATNTEAFSILTNLMLNLSSQIDILASYRNYSAKYYNIFSNGFSEYGHTQNEIGYYLGLKFKSQYGNLNIYYDIFKSPSQSFYSDFPLTGNDFLIHFDSKLTKSLLLLIKYKTELKEKQIVVNNANTFADELKSNFRVELKYKINKEFTGKSRVEFVRYSKSTETEIGFLSYQELKYHIPKYFTFYWRIVFFDTESYNTRLYEFENDLRGSMSNLPLYGEGFRWYLLLNFSPINYLTLSLKYAETYKPNVNYISSGNSQISGPVDNRISLQIDCKL